MGLLAFRRRSWRSSLSLVTSKTHGLHLAPGSAWGTLPWSSAGHAGGTHLFRLPAFSETILYLPRMSAVLERATTVRVLEPLRVAKTADTSSESIGGTPPNSVALRSTRSTPASLLNVAHMSQMWMISLEAEPRSAGGTRPPDAKAATLTPPSKSVYLPPRSG